MNKTEYSVNGDTLEARFLVKSAQLANLSLIVYDSGKCNVSTQGQLIPLDFECGIDLDSVTMSVESDTSPVPGYSKILVQATKTSRETSKVVFVSEA